MIILLFIPSIVNETTPAERIYSAPADARAYAVPAGDRVYRASALERTVEVS